MIYDLHARTARRRSSDGHVARSILLMKRHPDPPIAFNDRMPMIRQMLWYAEWFVLPSQQPGEDDYEERIL